MTQEEALSVLKTGLNVFLTGEPGSGKTHTINQYVTWLRERGIEPAVTASTGIAATHIGGYTIHSWSGIGIKNDISAYDIEMILSREKTAKRIIDAKVLIIDEISMLDAATLNSVDRVLRSLRRGVLMEERPFGGLQVIFVGDFFQLPPISKNEATKFAFESEAWKDANPVACYLNEQYRQDDGEFLDLLSAWRHGDLDTLHYEILESRLGKVPKKSVATRLYTHNANVDKVNAESLSVIGGSSRVFRMSSHGSRGLVETLKAQCLSPEVLELKEGAVVMFTRNNFEAGYVNGTLGEVTSFSPLGVPIVKTRSGKMIAAEQQEWAIQDGNKILAKVTQVPLRLAWAITVHKSQGMSLDAAVIDLSQAFEYGQGYVAVSRVRTLSGLFLEGFNQRALELHPKVAAADRHFRNYSAVARKKFEGLADDAKGEMRKNFLRAIGAVEARPIKIDEAKKSSIEILREKYPNVGKPWSDADDEQLTAMFKKKTPDAKIASHFGRKPSAIRARLERLELVPSTWKLKK